MEIDELVARASAARRVGDVIAAESLLMEAWRTSGDRADICNALGMVHIGTAPDKAAAWLERAAALDPTATALWLNLADARRRNGNMDGALMAFDRALSTDPYALPALVGKAQLLEALERLPESAVVYAAILSAYGANPDPAPAFEALFDHARDVVARVKFAKAQQLSGATRQVMEHHKGADFSRANAFLDIVGGRRRVFHPSPSGTYFPFLPAHEFFAPVDFPWFEKLKDATDDIRSELVALCRSRDELIDPYVQIPPGTPVNQWAALNGSKDWGVIFLWKDGVPQEANLAQCPNTLAALKNVPLLDIPGKAPTVMFSMLSPRTHIPPHTGTTNVRAIVHLPLIVPDGCRFRVGGDTRDVRLGELWAFDDTIEHEAWNDSDHLRSILILDVWNPYLTDAEREIIRVTGG